MELSDKNILLVDNDPHIIETFDAFALDNECELVVVQSKMEAIDIFSQQPVHVAVLDLNLSGFAGLKLLQEIKQDHQETEVIIITGEGTVKNAVTAVKMGAYDYLTKPFDDFEHVGLVVEKAIEKSTLMRRLHSYESWGDDINDFYGMIGKSKKMRKIFELVENVASSNSPVLITGESGTGKELVARALHVKSSRAHKPFVVINCAAMPANLLESELFGHVEGAFTGAVYNRDGLFTRADGGTIFLDEIGEIPLSIQVKLLRVLQDGEVYPLGSDTHHHVDVRTLAATNRDLHAAMKNGSFREDLYYRLHVIGIELPPLRDRAEDIPLLAYHFLNKYGKSGENRTSRISIDATQTLQEYRWMGNVRELENVIERAVVLSHSGAITARDLPPRLLGEVFYKGVEAEPQKGWKGAPYQQAKRDAMRRFNKVYLCSLLKKTRGNISMASRQAGMDRNNFRKIIKKYNIDAQSYKKA
jgi:two-component system, NtrC family, response regulator HydG